METPFEAEQLLKYLFVFVCLQTIKHKSLNNYNNNNGKLTTICCWYKKLNCHLRDFHFHCDFFCGAAICGVLKVLPIFIFHHKTHTNHTHT